MSSKKTPFEQLINQLLDHASYADALRELASNSKDVTKLAATLDSILLEEQVGAQFDFRGYSQVEKQTATLKKLLFLKDLLELKNVTATDKDFIVVNLCYTYVMKNYALTMEIVNNLNDIYKKYGS
jgi:hypothetical protein